MTDIRVRKLNEAFIRVECEPGILRELAERFTFYVPGYKFHPKFKSKVWDGKIRLLHIGNRALYFGLYARLQGFAKELGYSVSFEPSVLLRNNFSVKETEDLVDSLDLYSNKVKIEVRDYQIEAINRAIRDKKRLILSPTGSGKSAIFYAILRYLLDQGLRGALIVPNVQLVEQMFTDFQDYSSNNKWNTDENIHKIYAGQPKTSRKPVFLSTWQSIYDLDREYFEQFSFMLVDEVDTATAKCLKGMMEKSINAEYRIGLTGTLDESKTSEIVLEGLFGPIKRVVSTKTLMDRGHLANLKIKCPILKYPTEICKANQKFDYNTEQKFLNSCTQRTRFIRNLALSLKGNSVILFKNIEAHGRPLYNSLIEKAPDRKIFFVYGGTEIKEREQIRKLLEEENDVIVVASVVFSRGINIKRLNNLIFAIGAKSKRRVLQSIGRGLRTAKDKFNITLFDIVDDMKHRNRDNFSLSHFKERVAMYDNEGFDYRLYNIDLRM